MIVLQVRNWHFTINCWLTLPDFYLTEKNVAFKRSLLLRAEKTFLLLSSAVGGHLQRTEQGLNMGYDCLL